MKSTSRATPSKTCPTCSACRSLRITAISMKQKVGGVLRRAFADPILPLSSTFGNGGLQMRGIDRIYTVQVVGMVRHCSATGERSRADPSTRAVRGCSSFVSPLPQAADDVQVVGLGANPR